MAIKSRQGGRGAPSIGRISANNALAQQELGKGAGLCRSCSEELIRLMKDNHFVAAYGLFRSLEGDPIYGHRRQWFIFAPIQWRERFRFDLAARAFNRIGLAG